MKWSLYVEQHAVSSAFTTSSSWLILSPIEASIRRKIEDVGTPLKDWDITIKRGILTGYNEAFIISTAKRDEILANCQSEEERQRTADLIRPILRGKDIKRYGYDWAGLWLINTHNGVKGELPPINITLYPAIKAHLDSHWDRIARRSDQGITPYNLRDCTYVEEFDKPKIVYGEIQTDNEIESYPFPAFSFNQNKAVVLNSGYIMTSDSVDVRFILAVLNSKLGRFLVKQYVTQLQKRQFRMLAQYVELFPIPMLSRDKMDYIIKMIEAYPSHPPKEIEDKVERAVCSWYELNAEELAHIMENEF